MSLFGTNMKRLMNQYKDFIVNKFDLLMELKIFDIVDLLENIKEKQKKQSMFI